LSGTIGNLGVEGQYNRRVSHYDYNVWRARKVRKGIFPAARTFAGKKVYLQAGTSDKVVLSSSTKLTANFFKRLVGARNVKFNLYGYDHMVPSVATRTPYSSGASSTRRYFWNRKPVDSIKQMWQWIMPNKNIQPMAANYLSKGTYEYVDVKSLRPRRSWWAHERVRDYVRLYVPNSCAKGGCDLFVWMHGCT
jgi:hypothetical protein